MIQYIFTIFSWFYKQPFVNKIIKKSIMGYSYDKTIDYYLDSSLITPIEEDFIINYKVNSKDYILNCTSETYLKALSYIKTLTNIDENCVISAYEDNGENITDITENVIKYAGPDKDFHNFTEFHVTCSDITEHRLVIIKDLKIFVYNGDEYITLRYPKHSLRD